MPGASLIGKAKWLGPNAHQSTGAAAGLCISKVGKRLKRRRGLGRSSNQKREAPGNLPNSEYKIINR